MCLIVDPEKTKNFKRNNRRKEITVYKVVFSLGEGIYTPYRNTRVVPGQDLVAKEKCCPRYYMWWNFYQWRGYPCIFR